MSERLNPKLKQLTNEELFKTLRGGFFGLDDRKDIYENDKNKPEELEHLVKRVAAIVPKDQGRLTCRGGKWKLENVKSLKTRAV